MEKQITIIGAAIMDVLASPVKISKLEIGTQPMDDIRLSYGGDALNESVVLSRLGIKPRLISKIGDDTAGDQILKFLLGEGIDCEAVCVNKDVTTSMNIVLVDEKGERYFLTNPIGSMRKFAKKDVLKYKEHLTDFVVFTGMFVSPIMDIDSMEEVFKEIKSKKDRILSVDMTKPKNGEKLSDIKQLLKYVDFIFPNEDEISLITGKKDVLYNAERLVEAGVGCAVIKCGDRGCVIRTKDQLFELPAYKSERVIDTTGAGDSFVAGFQYGLINGFSLKECGLFANAVASCTVESLGATSGITSIEIPMLRYKELI